MVTIDERQAFSDRLNLVLDEEGYPPKGSGRHNRLAKDWGLTAKGVRKWVEGEGVPETLRQVEMAKRYGVSFEWLATGRDPTTLKHSSEVVRGMLPIDSKVSLSDGAGILVRAITRADSTGMPARVFLALLEMLRTFEEYRGDAPEGELDLNN
ncbi:hypothetical protein [Burkholderia gladioli]|uniref:hypothetical protein n=1 Tax=Burkholderia gladioli TaxID=28095 RepID=UPI00163EB4BF|nr:hypothetical protein [Burkholderia gladioli]